LFRLPTAGSKTGLSANCIYRLSKSQLDLCSDYLSAPGRASFSGFSVLFLDGSPASRLAAVLPGSCLGGWKVHPLGAEQRAFDFAFADDGTAFALVFCPK